MIRDRSTKPKIQSSKSGQNQGCSSEQHPWFSFRYMTQNKQFSLEYLNKLNSSDRESTLVSLFKRLEELSCKPWLYWTQQPKKTGLETISYDQLHFSPNISLSKDTTIYVFRFDTYRGNGKGRILGFKGAPCSVLHVIGYDFTLSAYDH